MGFFYKQYYFFPHEVSEALRFQVFLSRVTFDLFQTTFAVLLRVNFIAFFINCL